jgi:outer membrane protein assembly factor BamB
LLEVSVPHRVAHAASVSVIAICLTIVVPARAQNTPASGWAQFRGPNATGIAAVSKAPPAEFGPDKNLLWKTAVPPGHSSPVLWGDRIFLTAFDADRQRLLVLGLDRTTGRVLWRQEVSYEALGPSHAMSSPATATPVVDGERVYAYFVQAGLFAYALDGTPAWRLPLPAEKVRFGNGTSPVLAGDLLVLNRDTIANGSILAVDRRSGTIKWQVARELLSTITTQSSYSTPVVVGDQVVVHGLMNVTAYDAATGEKRWWVRASTSGTSTPAVVGDMVYVGTWSPFGEPDQMTPLPDFPALLRAHDTDHSGTINQTELTASGIKVYARPDVPDVPGASMAVPFAIVDDDKNGELTAEEWAGLLALMEQNTVDHGLLAIRAGGRGDVATSRVVWREKRSIPEVPSPLVYENRVYYVRNGGILTCLDATTGRVVYRGRLGAAGPYFSSPIAAGGRLFVGSGEGALVVFAPGDELKVLARNNFEEQIFATPAVSPDGILYVRTPSALYAVGER